MVLPAERSPIAMKGGPFATQLPDDLTQRIKVEDGVNISRAEEIVPETIFVYGITLWRVKRRPLETQFAPEPSQKNLRESCPMDRGKFRYLQGQKNHSEVCQLRKDRRGTSVWEISDRFWREKKDVQSTSKVLAPPPFSFDFPRLSLAIQLGEGVRYDENLTDSWKQASSTSHPLDLHTLSNREVQQF